MKLERLNHSPAAVLDFYDEALTALGAVCERTWHDRLHVLAEGPGARLWNDTGALHEVELWFPPAEDTAPREAGCEIFPGCPATFRLAEALRPAPLELERVVLRGEDGGPPPDPEVTGKLWRAQFPDTHRWQLDSAFTAAHHFSLLALLRCEVQAIDQHWSLRRVAVSLPDGSPDLALAQSLDFLESADATAPLAWPPPDPERWRRFLHAALEADLEADLAAIRARQANHLRRELDRVDDYFEHYEAELAARAGRTRNESTRMKTGERLAAAKAEHGRRRADQVARHEIRVLSHVEALLVIAEPAWQAGLRWELRHQPRAGTGRYIPRLRRWMLDAPAAVPARAGPVMTP
ncbi:MAG: hypothetical protein MUE94_12325 [Verrucomicrobia bacterium]|jgi:hypothetical protein|nr:hypothetical protein [Verrucomicrobiota bacterium]